MVEVHWLLAQWPWDEIGIGPKRILCTSTKLERDAVGSIVYRPTMRDPDRYECATCGRIGRDLLRGC